jgi:hypothetical protein
VLRPGRPRQTHKYHQTPPQSVSGLGSDVTAYYCDGNMEAEQDGAALRLVNYSISPTATEAPVMRSMLAKLIR